MRLRFKVAWMWNKDVYEDMWNHGCLIGVLGVITRGMPDQTVPMPWTPDHPSRDYFYLYIGLGLFYLRFMADRPARIHPNLIQTEGDQWD